MKALLIESELFYPKHDGKFDDHGFALREIIQHSALYFQHEVPEPAYFNNFECRQSHFV